MTIKVVEMKIVYSLAQCKWISERKSGVRESFGTIWSF